MAGDELRRPAIRILTVAEEPAAPDLLSSAGALQAQADGWGLLGFNERGQIAPALARSWNVSEDGRQYVFRLRPGSRWSDGTTVEAKDAASALTRILKTRAGHPLGALLAPVEAVGAPTPSVVEIQLSRPSPSLLAVLAHPAASIVDRKRAVAGPYQSTSQTGQTDDFALVARTGSADPQIGRARVTALSQRLTFAGFNNGGADIVTGARLSGLMAARDTGARDGTLRIEPALGYVALDFGRAAGVLQDPRLRAALSLAVDRAGLARGLFATPAFREEVALLPAPAAGPLGPIVPEWAAQPLAARRSAAAVLGDEAGVTLASPVTLTLDFAAGPEFDAIARALAAAWEPLGVTVRGRVRPARAHAEFTAKGQFQIALIEHVAPVPSSAWFLDRLRCGRAEAWRCSPEADIALDYHQATGDPGARAKAERLLLARVPIIPLFTAIRWSLVSPRISGWMENDQGSHPIAALGISAAGTPAR